MLKIYFGDMPEAIYNTSVYFNNVYGDNWLQDAFAQKAIKRVDKSTVLGSGAIDSPVLGVIAPENLSGGVKTVLLIKNEPNKVFNASTCGDNCAGLILEIARERDITINLRHVMDFGKRRFTAQILNTGVIVHTMAEIIDIAYDYV